MTKDMFCCDKHVFVMTNVSLSRQNFCCNKIIFVVTNICPEKSFVATKICLLRQKFCSNKHTFVTTKDVFCHDKHVNKGFVMTKMKFVAALANDSWKNQSMM